MRIDCPCGSAIRDSTDNLPHKGHLIPDEDWFATFDAIDDQVVGPLSSGEITAGAAGSEFRFLISDPSLTIYQCRDCGRLFFPGPDRKLHVYAPEDAGTSREILRARPDAT